MRRDDKPSSNPGPSSPYRFYRDCITATRGYDFRERQVGEQDAEVEFARLLQKPLKILVKIFRRSSMIR
jgi:hypothetical protein